mgnify:CR=1 FL=1
MALNFQIPKQKKNKGIETISSGFGLNMPVSILPPLPSVILGDLPEGVSIFGTPYYGAVFFEKPAYGVPEYNEETKQYETAFVSLAANRIMGGTQGCFIQDCIIDVNTTNNIVKTEIMGQNGTVKEYINQGDAQITIRGFFSSPLPDRFPEINTRMLRSYLIAPLSLNITNSFLNDVFGITSIAIESFNFFQQQGLRNVQYFQINAISDTVVKIKELSK